MSQYQDAFSTALQDPGTWSNGCRMKERFTSKKHANGMVRVQVQRGISNPNTLNSYKCAFCHGWHIGNSRRRLNSLNSD